MDANRALEYLNKFILHGKEVWLVCKEAVLITCLKIKLSWTPGKGMMGKQWKDCWDCNHGCSYIPVTKLDLQVVKNKVCCTTGSRTSCSITLWSWRRVESLTRRLCQTG